MYKVLKFNLAREALSYLISKYNIKEINLPYYLCDVIRHSVIISGCKPKFYHINDNFLPMTEFKKYDYILYPNYFGICNNNVDTLVNKYPNIIIDNAHSFYSEPKGFAAFNSERKFKSVKSGAYLYIKSNKNTMINIEQTPKERINKFLYMHNKYSLTNHLDINPKYAKSPFCYPYLASTEEEADKIVSELTQRGYTIFRYWNNLPKTYNEYKFYSRLIPIPLIDKKLSE